MDLKKVRTNNWSIISKKGLIVNKSLPLLDDNFIFKNKEELINRIICVNSMVLLAFNVMSKIEIRSQFNKFPDLLLSLTHKEKDFLIGNDNEKKYFMQQVESLYILAWALGLVNDIDFNINIPNNLAKSISLNTGDTIIEFKKRCSKIPTSKILLKLDYAYCIDWVNTELYITKNEEYAYPYVIKQRRRALEWMAYESQWDEIVLDT